MTFLMVLPPIDALFPKLCKLPYIYTVFSIEFKGSFSCIHVHELSFDVIMRSRTVQAALANSPVSSCWEQKSRRVRWGCPQSPSPAGLLPLTTWCLCCHVCIFSSPIRRWGQTERERGCILAWRLCWQQIFLSCHYSSTQCILSHYRYSFLIIANVFVIITIIIIKIITDIIRSVLVIIINTIMIIKMTVILVVVFIVIIITIVL